jgi:hypothetical protein
MPELVVIVFLRWDCLTTFCFLDVGFYRDFDTPWVFMTLRDSVLNLGLCLIA